MATQIVCNYNKFGFCKFKETCRKQHINKVCENSSCDVLTCTLRHPKECKYYRDFNRCRFGEWCSFAHVHKEDQNLKLENEKMQEKLAGIEKNSIEKDEQIESLKLENAKINNKLSEIEKNNSDKEEQFETIKLENEKMKK